MSPLKDFTTSSARPLPVLLLADVSGSMSVNGKIAALNDAVAEMYRAFAAEDAAQAEIHVAVVTFGGSAGVHRELGPAADTSWEPMQASGGTPMGAAFDIARELVEDRERIPSRAYRPTVVLVSDGQPTDEWTAPLERLLGSERASKAARFALAIGDDADREMLQAFLADPEQRVFEAHEAGQIRQFFRFVTMTVTSRSRSASPNDAASVAPTDLDDFEF